MGFGWSVQGHVWVAAGQGIQRKLANPHQVFQMCDVVIAGHNAGPIAGVFFNMLYFFVNILCF
jgi:hypothetical protein